MITCRALCQIFVTNKIKSAKVNEYYKLHDVIKWMKRIKIDNYETLCKLLLIKFVAPNSSNSCSNCIMRLLRLSVVRMLDWVLFMINWRWSSLTIISRRLALRADLCFPRKRWLSGSTLDSDSDLFLDAWSGSCKRLSVPRLSSIPDWLASEMALAFLRIRRFATS